MVESVKCLESNLQLMVFVVGHLESLMQARIKVFNSRSVEHVTAFVSEEAERGYGIGSGVEPLIDRTFGRVQWYTGNSVGPVIRAKVSIGVIRRQIHRKGSPGLE